VQFAGRAEPIRLAFHIGGVAFEDERLPFPEFGAKKAAGVFKNGARCRDPHVICTDVCAHTGSVPVLYVGDYQLAQSNAILTYAGTVAGKGLVPSDALEAAKVCIAASTPIHLSILTSRLSQVQEVLASVEDAAGVIASTMSEQDLAKKIALREALIASDGKFTKWIAALSAILSKNGTGYFVGNSLTIADLKYFTFLGWFTSGVLGMRSLHVNVIHALISAFPNFNRRHSQGVDPQLPRGT
jgi:glutathione S-transferase